MRSMSINELQEVNGGAKYYSCRVCGYTNSSFWNVYAHCLTKEVLPVAADIAAIACLILAL